MASIGKDRSKVKKDEKREEEVDVEKAKSGSSRMIFLKFQMSSQAAGTTHFFDDFSVAELSQSGDEGDRDHGA
jgi:hypothetical protein